MQWVQFIKRHRLQLHTVLQYVKTNFQFELQGKNHLTAVGIQQHNRYKINSFSIDISTDLSIYHFSSMSFEITANGKYTMG